MSLANTPVDIERFEAIRTKGRTLIISRSPSRTVTGVRKLCLAEAIMRLRTSRSPFCAEATPGSSLSGPCKRGGRAGRSETEASETSP